MTLPESGCNLCGAPATREIFGYAICPVCYGKLGLYTDATIQKHLRNFANDPNKSSYPAEVRNRLEAMQKSFIRSEIKLLHILDRMQKMGVEE